MFEKLVTHGAFCATFASGYIGASPWVILAGAVMRSSLRSEAHLEFAGKYAVALGSVRTWALFTSASVAGNALWCALAFGLGRAVAIVT